MRLRRARALPPGPGGSGVLRRAAPPLAAEAPPHRAGGRPRRGAARPPAPAGGPAVEEEIPYEVEQLVPRGLIREKRAPAGENLVLTEDDDALGSDVGD